MADFVQTMKDWRRMCKVYTTDDDSCCEGCPVVDYHEHGCGAVFEMDDSTDWQRYAETIMSWAAENPAPVYPTWKDWLFDIGVVSNATICEIQNMKYIYADLCKHIPADIAEKLGLKPKEQTP